MAETLSRSKSRLEANKKTNKTFPKGKLFLRIGLGVIILSVIALMVGFFKKDNIQKKNDSPQSFPVTIQTQGVRHVENS